MFRNAFFYLYWPNDTAVMSAAGAGARVFPEFSRDGDQVRPYLLTQTKTRRLTVSNKQVDRFGRLPNFVHCMEDFRTINRV